MAEHRLATKPKGVRGKIRGGRAVGCTGCGWMTFGGSLPQLIRAHAQHVREIDIPTPVDPLDALEAQLATIKTQLAELVN